jgi:hypothetical protein
MYHALSAQKLFGVLFVGAVVCLVPYGALAMNVAAPFQGMASVPAEGEWSNKRLSRFMADMTDFIYEHHVVRQTDAYTFGMTYEFYDDGKKYQAFGLDTMHDGVWFASAMMTAHRADPTGRYLERTQQFQVPFYVNVINNSHIIFPEKIRRQDNKPLEEPLRGWVPRGWDEGIGYVWGTDDRFGTVPFKHPDETSVIHNEDGSFRYAYFTPSNHLAQDLADGLLDVWYTTKDPALTEAVGHVYAFRNEYFGKIPVIAGAYGTMSGNENLRGWMQLPEFDPTRTLAYRGLYLQHRAGLAAYDDGLAWQYRHAVSDAVKHGRFDPAQAWRFANHLDSNVLAMDLYFDDRPAPWGVFFFDLVAPSYFLEGEGKLRPYRSDDEPTFGARGIQFAWIAAGILPALREHPQAWEARYHTRYSDDALIRIVDDVPVVDGKRDKVFDRSQLIEWTGTRASMVSSTTGLSVFVESSTDEVEFALTPAEDVVGRKHQATIRLSRKGLVAIANEQGDPLDREAVFSVSPDRWAVELHIPYAVNPGQAVWMNGVEHGRYRLTSSSGPQINLYMLSEPQRIIRRMEHLVIGTIDTWHEVYRKVGCVPSGYEVPMDRDSRIMDSDTGNVAQLIKTIALLLIDRQKQTEWSRIADQMPTSPLPHKPLPRTVRQKLGVD